MLVFLKPASTFRSAGHVPFANDQQAGKPLLWPIMEKAGWLPIPKDEPTPDNLRDICLNVEYECPFEFIFYCYYAFPTNYPEDIQKIFGKEYFDRVIEPEAMAEFRKTIQDNGVQSGGHLQQRGIQPRCERPGGSLHPPAARRGANPQPDRWH